MAITVIVLMAATIVIIKQTRQYSPTHQGETKIASAPQSILLVADPNEADASCGCGEIIRMVRAVTQGGINVTEIAPEDTEIAKRHRVVVAPTLLIFAENGKEVARFEGESATTVDSIRAALERITASTK